MIRFILLVLFCTFLCVYAWRDWYKALCGLIILMAVVEHPDMPKSLMGIQGLNPWNICLAFVVIAWASKRGKEGLLWDMPKGTNLLLWAYLLVIVVGFIRLAGSAERLTSWYALAGEPAPGFGSLVSEHIINTVKWVIPGLLLFDGCRDPVRLRWGVAAFLGIYLLLAVQVIRWMPLGSIGSGAELTERSLKILSNEVGYHRVNLAVLLAGAAWAIFAVRPLASGNMARIWILVSSGVALFGLALTGGRAGYATWAATGFILAMLRWRKYLLVGPIIAAIVISFVPAVQERFTQGFTAETRDTNTRVQSRSVVQGDEPDAYTITAGRNVAWPFVLDKIADRPLVGYGLEAMKTTGTATKLAVEYGEVFPHPHNAYLQAVFDNGIIGALPIFIFYLLILKRSASLFLDSRSPEFIALGGASLALVAALMMGAMGSQSFYPREGAVGMWCAIGLMLRVHVERSRAVLAALKESEKLSVVGNVAKNLWGRPATPVPG